MRRVGAERRAGRTLKTGQEGGAGKMAEESDESEESEGSEETGSGTDDAEERGQAVTEGDGLRRRRRGLGELASGEKS